MNKSLSPWLLGSTLFFRDTFDDASILQKTLQNYPIDTICGSEKDYRLLDRDRPAISSQLQQLFSVEPIEDAEVKDRWRKLTNLSIDDGEEMADERSVSFHSTFVTNRSSSLPLTT